MPGKGCVTILFNGGMGRPCWEDGEDGPRLLRGESLAMLIPREIEFQEEGKDDPEAEAFFMF